jgi:hypothetical protein
VNKKRVSLYASIILATLIIAASALFLTNSGIAPFSKATIVAYAAGVPDALGNRISAVSFGQNSTGSWSTVASLAYGSYVLNYNLTIPANQHTLVSCVVFLNSSLAADAATAMSRTRVYLTISGVVTSASMIVQGATLVAPNYWVTLQWPSVGSPPASTWTPATDTTYTITFQYQAYY